MMNSPFLRYFFLSLILLSSNGAKAQLPTKRHMVDLTKVPADIRKDLGATDPQLVGKELSFEEIDNLVRKLQQDVNVDSVTAIEESGKVTLHIKRTQRIRLIRFAGLAHFSEYDAKQILGIAVNDPIDQQALIDGGERLRVAYKEAGYLNTVIDIELPTAPDGNIEVALKITENKPTEISSVAVNSTNAELNKRLQQIIKSYAGKNLTDATVADIQKDLKEYLAKYRYMKSEVVGPLTQFNSDETKAAISFRIEHPESYSVQFDGIRFFKTRELDSELELDKFTSTSPNLALELAAKIRNYYLGRGFARVEVQADEVPDRDPNSKTIKITIDEGPRVKIEKIELQGRYQRPSTYYSDFLSTNSSDLISKGYYFKEDIDSGLKLLANQMQNDGYLLAKVVSTRAQYNLKKDKVTIFVNLDEGPLTEIDSIHFEGNYFANKDALMKISELASSGPLKLNSIEKALANIKQYYKENGFIEMTVVNEKDDLVIYDESNTRAKLNFKIYEGPKVKVASIVIDGNSFTKDYVILTELDFEVGDTLTPNKIEESLSRLQRSGHFGNVEIKTLEEKTSVSNRTIIVRVTERDPGIFTMGLGATNERDFTVRGYLGVAYRNIKGTGRAISMRLEGNYNVTDIRYLESKITVGYLEPYLFNTRNKGRINVSRTKSVTDYDIKQATEINQTTASVERDFSSHILGVYQVWGLATVRDYAIAGASFAETLVDIATTGPSVDLDYRDNIFNPTKGSFTHLAYEYSAPWLGSSSTIHYYKTSASYTQYTRLNDKPWVWANNLRFGYLQNLSDATNGGVPWDKVGFTLGGRSTVRGFEAGTNEVFPNKYILGSSKYLLTTQSRMYLLKSEVRFPIFGNFAGAVFYDGGAVYIDGLSLSDPYRDSAGFGIRYNTPVGPLNLEFGWKLDKKDGEEPWRFHLSIGAF